MRSAEGVARSGPAVLVISLYERQDDAAPRWIEYQSVTLDAQGRYDVQFGATRDEGLPAELFTGDAATRWVGVAIENEPEQPRVMLVSVPYAAKAASADTLAGMSASDFVLASTFRTDLRTVLQEEGLRPGSDMVGTASVNSGFIPRFSNDAGLLGNSALFDNGTYVGIGTTSPAAPLHVVGNANGSTGFQVRNTNNGSNASVSLYLGNDLDPGMGGWEMFSSAAPSVGRKAPNGMSLFGSGSGGLALSALDPAGAVRFFAGGSTERMRITNAGNVGIGTATPTARLQVAGDVVVDGNLGVKYAASGSGATIAVCIGTTGFTFVRPGSACPDGQTFTEIPTQGTQGPQGPVGPQGPAGPAGPQGPQGLPGPSNGVSGYEQTEWGGIASVLGGGLVTASVSCAPGKRAIGGGSELNQASSPKLQLVTSAPNLTGSGWVATYYNPSESSLTANIFVIAVCAVV